MEPPPSGGLSTPTTPLHRRAAALSSRMQYRSRPVSVAVDPVSLVISECIAITSAIQKHARSPHSSVSAILGGAPNPVQLGPPNRARKGGPPSASAAGDGDSATANRWGLRGKKGKSMADHPLISAFGRLRQDLTGVRGTCKEAEQDVQDWVEGVYASYILTVGWRRF